MPWVCAFPLRFMLSTGLRYRPLKDKKHHPFKKLTNRLIKAKLFLSLMKEEIKKEILYDLTETIRILQEREKKDLKELEELSNHGIEDVAAHKDIDLVSVTVLIYSFYKIIDSISEENYTKILKEIIEAKQSLELRQFGKYNRNMKTLFQLVKKSNAQIKVHFHDVLDAAKIKKSALLFSKGLSIGQAAGLMGLSNWDLQSYAGKTTALDQHEESIPAAKRVSTALKIFGVS